MRLAAALALVLLATADAAAWQSGDVTIYRCTDAKGHVTLSDSPCAKGSDEQVRTMQRPRDAPPRATPVPVAPAPQATMPPPQVVVVRTPQPMYECVTPDGERYTSETADGNPRWVPLWTLGYRSGWRGGRRSPANAATERLNAYVEDRPLGGYVGASSPVASAPDTARHRPHPRPPGTGYGTGAGTWVRDTCHALPQGEVCARLVDRRDEIRRRFFNAQETERNTLRIEERGINARLSADCG